MLIGRAARLAEPVAREGFLGPGDVRLHPVEHRAPGFVTIEAEIKIVVQEAAALRQAEANRLVALSSEWIGTARGIRLLETQEGDDIARRGIPHSHHHGILRRIDQLIDRARIESRRPLDQYL